MFANLSVMIVTYFTYIAIGVGLTAWVARQLNVHGRVFLAKGCKGNEELADSLGHLLSVGFLLLHFGFVLLTLKLGGVATETAGAIELLSTKTGLVLIVLAVSHFFHLALYARIHGKPRPVGVRGRDAGVVTAEMVKA
ncbi:MAG: hypothetical protein QF918_04700 [Pirellulaceae bacterium]|jgi:hypothetical protein|nr:hypothetical protein [Pirellulaceae bacterium]MDP6555361.1 hypothetical protein [Pirellulaceae bacterium]MDP6719472.1 hypothetical protein [Pirellulaceae bacterium]